MPGAIEKREKNGRKGADVVKGMRWDERGEEKLGANAGSERGDLPTGRVPGLLPSFELWVRENAVAFVDQAGVMIYSLWGLSPRPMAHETITLATELRELDAVGQERLCVTNAG